MGIVSEIENGGFDEEIVGVFFYHAVGLLTKYLSLSSSNKKSKSKVKK